MELGWHEEIDERRISCPHCLTIIWCKWENIGASVLDTASESSYLFRHTYCPSCRRVIIELRRSFLDEDSQEWFVVPAAVSRQPIPPEVPEEFAADYREACLVLPHSEKASAALSRRCLQRILRAKGGVKPGTLDSEIAQVLSSQQLPSSLAENLDAVRQIGNFAAHPIKSQKTGEILDVEAGEAQWSLELIEDLFDFYFVQPARSKAKRDAFNQKLAEAGKPPLKGS